MTAVCRARTGVLYTQGRVAPGRCPRSRLDAVRDDGAALPGEPDRRCSAHSCLWGAQRRLRALRGNLLPGEGNVRPTRECRTGKRRCKPSCD